MTDLESQPLLSAILGDPEEWTRYGVFADYLDEGGEPELAYAFRWMMRRRLRPHNRRYHYDLAGHKGRAVSRQFSWAWYTENFVSLWRRDRLHIPSYSLLPRVVFLAGGPVAKHHLFPSFLDACTNLASSLDQLHEDWLLEPGDD